MLLFDSHCHINFNAFKEDGDEMIRRCLDNGIGLNVVGSQSITSKRALEYAKKHDGVYATVGLHPIHLFAQEVDEEEDHFATRAEEFDYEFYKELASHDKVIAIGEMGLDYYRIEGLKGFEGVKGIEGVKEKQREAFVQGLRLSQELNKPIVIHARAFKGTYDAYEDVYEIVSSPPFRRGELEVGQREATSPLSAAPAAKSSPWQGEGVRGVMHCFGGTLEQARKFVDLGMYIGITGIVTFKNAIDIQEIAKEIPLDKILIETDAPYLAPVPYRGKRNEPSYVKYVAEKIAEIKNISFEEVAEVTTENAKRLFK